jgi:hypothetical protein
MQTVMFIYFLVGFIVSLWLYDYVDDGSISGETILSFLHPRISVWFREHQVSFEICVMLGFVLIIFIWPYVLYRVIDYEKRG